MKNKQLGMTALFVACVSISIAAYLYLWAAHGFGPGISLKRSAPKLGMNQLEVDQNTANKMSKYDSLLPDLTKPRVRAKKKGIDVIMLGGSKNGDSVPMEDFLLDLDEVFFNYKVTMTYVADGHKYGVINGQFYKEGDTLPEGGTVLLIYENAIQVLKEGVAKWLPVNGEEPSEIVEPEPAPTNREKTSMRQNPPAHGMLAMAGEVDSDFSYSLVARAILVEAIKAAEENEKGAEAKKEEETKINPCAPEDTSNRKKEDIESKAKQTPVMPMLMPPPLTKEQALKQLDEAQIKVDEARAKLAGRKGIESSLKSLDMAQNLLDTARANLMGEKVVMPGVAQTREELLKMFDDAQMKLNNARITAAGSPELLKKLDDAQARLDTARQQAISMPGSK